MNQPSILIVDDEIGPRESLRMILKPTYQVYTAEDGKKAIEIIHQQAIDLVTLDLRMPGVSGIEVLKAIKKYNSDIEVVIITGYGTLKTAVDGIRWGVFDYITKPFNVAEIISVIKKAVERRKLNVHLGSLLNNVQELGIKSDFDVVKSTLQENQPLIEKIRKIFNENAKENGSGDPIDFLEFIKVLSCTLESKDPYTHGHSGRVSYYSNLITEKLPFTKEEKNELQIATFLHDIGKVGVSNEYIFKKTALTDKEWEIVKQHPIKGVDLIEPLNVSPFILSVIRHHHERMDGKGYPDGLKGDEISLAARVVGLAYAYDAMTTDRPYRIALSKDAVIRELRVNAGTQFDPKLVEIFLGFLENGDLIALN